MLTTPNPPCLAFALTAVVKGDVDHFAALSFLCGLLLILKDSGYSGLVLVLDEISVTPRKPKIVNALTSADIATFELKPRAKTKRAARLLMLRGQQG